MTPQVIGSASPIQLHDCGGKDCNSGKRLVKPVVAGSVASRPLGVTPPSITSMKPALVVGQDVCCARPQCPGPCPSGTALQPPPGPVVPSMEPAAIPKLPPPVGASCCGQPGCPGPQPCPEPRPSVLTASGVEMRAVLTLEQTPCCKQECPKPLPATCLSGVTTQIIPFSHITAATPIPPLKTECQVSASSKEQRDSLNLGNRLQGQHS